MKYALIVDGVVVQVQPYPQDGFVEVPDDVLPYQIANPDGTFSNPLLSPKQLQATLEAALDAHIDSVARAKGYDSRITAAMRAGYPNPWQQEGIAFGQWMDTCYAKLYQILAEVEAGNRQLPTTEELIAEMPKMVWPN